MPEERPSGRIIFVRHGQTAWNAEGRCQGWEDEPLDERGRHDAVQVAERLRAWRVDQIVSSDLARARQTAEVIARVKGMPLRLEKALREVNFGRCQGLRLADLAGTELGEHFRDFRLGRRFDALPGGEHPCETLERAQGFLNPLLAGLRGQHVVIVGHGSTFRLIFCSFLQIPLRQWRFLDQGNTGLTVFDVEGDVFRLALFNDTCHLHHQIAEQHGTDLVQAE